MKSIIEIKKNIIYYYLEEKVMENNCSFFERDLIKLVFVVFNYVIATCVSTNEM